jgi:hypothetical protein
MFHQELLTYAATNSDRHTLQVDQAIEEFYPPAAAGLTATLHLPNGRSTSVKLDNQDEAGVVRFTDTHLSGLYRLKLDGFPDRSFAVNVPEVNAGSLNESDLKRIDPAEFRSLGEQWSSPPLDHTDPPLPGTRCWWRCCCLQRNLHWLGDGGQPGQLELEQLADRFAQPIRNGGFEFLPPRLPWFHLRRLSFSS